MPMSAAMPMRNPEPASQDDAKSVDLREMLALFADELSAQRYMETILWPNGMVCPNCGEGDRVGELNGASTRVGTYKCYACRKSFSVTHGTIFHSSHVPIHKWLQAIYLTDGGTKEIKPHHLQQVLNVTSKTASSMISRLGEAAMLVGLQPPTADNRHEAERKETTAGNSTVNRRPTKVVAVGPT
jgi:transposase-like protein